MTVAYTTPMLLIVGTVRLAPDKLTLARTAMEHMIMASRAEQGCHGYNYAEDLLEPGLMHVKEVWESREALDMHFESPHLAAWRTLWPTLGIFDRDLRLYEVGEAVST